MRAVVVVVVSLLLCAARGEDAALKKKRRFSEEEYQRLARILGERSPAQREVGTAQVDVDGTVSSSSDVDAAMSTLEGLGRRRLEELLADTWSDECRRLVTSRFTEIYSRLLREDWLPFETTSFRTECPQENVVERGVSKEASDIRLCYVILAHEEPDAVVRLVRALSEEDRRHSFVVHVDAKATETYETLRTWSLGEPRVVVVEDGRADVSWGGFSVVRATLVALDEVLRSGFEFDWIVTVSGYTYPLVSNAKIRETLATYPGDSEFMEIRPQPNEPSPRAWHQYVECDGKMRRIYRLTPPNGIRMYMGSQWMIVTKEFARYVVGSDERAEKRRFDAAMPGHGADARALSDAQGTAYSFAEAYEAYGRYTMVADENFFVTVLKNSPFCRKHVNDNFLHVQFDRWENEKPQAAAQKCLQPNPRHCGRSPTTLTLDYLPVLELGGALFARKFDARKDASILDALDEKRLSQTGPEYVAPTKPHFSNVRIAWRPHHHRDAPKTELCVSMNSSFASRSKPVTFAPCDASNPDQRFNVGPCSTDGNITLGRPAVVVPGDYAPAPFCPVYADGAGHGNYCLDLEREQIDPGTRIIAYPCSGRWNQLFGFGAQRPKSPTKPTAGHVFISVPYAFHVPKELCLETDYPNLKVMACLPAKLEQVFHVEPIPSLPE